MITGGDSRMQEESVSAALALNPPPPIVSGAAEYVTRAEEISADNLAYLYDRIQTVQRQESVLWMLFVLVFVLTLATGCTGVVLILLASLKVGIASGAAGLLPGCLGAWLRRECTVRGKNRQAIEAKRDEELRLRQAFAAIDDLPPGPQKEELRVERARRMLSRISK
jgi:hypothetical protein